MPTKVAILMLLLFATWVYGADPPSYPHPSASYVAVPTNIPDGTHILDISNHNIATLTTGIFSKLNNLLKLVMKRNIITTIEKDAFKGLDNLQSLDLSYNKLTSIEVHYFENLPRLQALILVTNSIKSIAPGSLTPMQNLQHLGLQGNQLTEAPWEELRSLPKLAAINLNNNNLQTVPEGLYTGWKSLRQLYFHDNPFHCDCRLRWLKKSTQGNFLGSLVYRCATPKSLQGALLAMVPAAHLVCTKATIKLWEGVVTAKVGEKVVLVCQAEGDPQPEIAWTTPDGTTIKQGETAGKMAVASHGTLTISKAMREDGGAYTCTASNAGGHDTKVTKVNIVGKDGRILPAATTNQTAGIPIWEGPEFPVAMGIVAMLALTLGLICVGVFFLVKKKAAKEKPAMGKAGENQAVPNECQEGTVRMSDVEKSEKEVTERKEDAKEEEDKADKPASLQVSDMGNV